MRRGPRRVAAHAGSSLLVTAFFLAIIFPPDVVVNLGSIKLPIYRLVLILGFIPCVLRLFAGANGPMNKIDLFVFLYAMWSVLALLRAHGLEAWQFCGITFLETIVPYLIARTYVCSAPDFRRMAKTYFLIILIMLPFAVFETVTGKHLLRDLFRAAMGMGPIVGRPGRLGLDRAFGSFEHPIHYGIFCASILGIVISLQSSFFKMAIRYVILFVAVACSLSSGPLMAFVVQSGLKAWDLATKGIANRWRLLTGIFIVLYILVDILSNRTPFHVFVTYLTLRMESAYNRILIWEFGTQSVEKFPLFGIGLNEWERPYWMSSSMDNFWLVIAVRYGLPALLFFSLAFLILFRRISRLKLAEELAPYRTGWVISMVGMMIVGSTVHYWNSLYCLFMFMVGASTWLLRSPSARAADGSKEQGRQRVPVVRETVPRRRGEGVRGTRPARQRPSETPSLDRSERSRRGR